MGIGCCIWKCFGGAVHDEDNGKSVRDKSTQNESSPGKTIRGKSIEDKSPRYSGYFPARTASGVAVSVRANSQQQLADLPPLELSRAPLHPDAFLSDLFKARGLLGACHGDAFLDLRGDVGTIWRPTPFSTEEPAPVIAISISRKGLGFVARTNASLLHLIITENQGHRTQSGGVFEGWLVEHQLYSLPETNGRLALGDRCRRIAMFEWGTEPQRMLKNYELPPYVRNPKSASKRRMLPIERPPQYGSMCGSDTVTKARPECEPTTI